MAKQYDGQDVSFKAENDLSSKQYYFVEISGNGQVDACDGTTDNAIGILQNKPTTGQEALVRIFGHSKVSADEALSANDPVGVSTDGQAAVVVPGSDAGERWLGVCTYGCGSAGDIAEIVFFGCSYLAT